MQIPGRRSPLATVGGWPGAGTWATCSRAWSSASANARRSSPGHLRLTYAELDERANRLVAVLVARGVGPGDRVGLALRNGHEYLEALLASFKLRAVPFNVNYRYTADELAYLFGDAASASGHPRARPRRRRRPGRRRPPRRRRARGGAGRAGRPPRGPAGRRIPDPTDPAGRSGDDRYLLYTGGTTGMPKGVLWRHEDLLFAALGAAGAPRSAATRPTSPRTPAELVERAGTGRCRPSPPRPSPTARPTGSPSAPCWRRHGRRRSPRRTVRRPPTLGPRRRRAGHAARDRRRRVRPTPRRRPPAEPDAVRPRRACWWSSPAGRSCRRSVRDAAARPAALDRGRRRLRHVRDRRPGQMPVWAGQQGPPPPRFHVDEHTAVLDDAGRPRVPGIDTGRIGRLARRGHIPLGYHDDPERTGRRPSRRSTASAGRSPATSAGSRPTARHPARPGRSRRSTPVARRSSPTRSRPSSRAIPRCSTPSWSACPTSAGASGWCPSVAPPGASDDADDLVAHCRCHLARSRSPGGSCRDRGPARGPPASSTCAGPARDGLVTGPTTRLTTRQI